MREYDNYDDENIRLYTPVLQRVIILAAVIIAVPVMMWTITSFSAATLRGRECRRSSRLRLPICPRTPRRSRRRHPFLLHPRRSIAIAAHRRGRSERCKALRRRDQERASQSGLTAGCERTARCREQSIPRLFASDAGALVCIHCHRNRNGGNIDDRQFRRRTRSIGAEAAACASIG